MIGILAVSDKTDMSLVDYYPSRDGEALCNLMIIGDHASNHIPDDLDLGIDPTILATHRAVDLGTASVSQLLHRQSGCAVANARISRLVVDLNRYRDEETTIPAVSDGITIAGNQLSDAEHEARLRQYYDIYHAQIGTLVGKENPRLIIFLHSFTPRLETQDAQRPWHYGIMYDEDERAGHIALSYFDNLQITAGDQLPYSGKIYNSSFNRHAQSNSIAYVGLEVRQDLLEHENGRQDAAEAIRGMAERILQGN